MAAVNISPEQAVRDVLLETSGTVPCKSLQDGLFAIGLIITDHAFNIAYRLKLL